MTPFQHSSWGQRKHNLIIPTRIVPQMFVAQLCAHKRCRFFILAAQVSVQTPGVKRTQQRVDTNHPLHGCIAKSERVVLVC